MTDSLITMEESRRLVELEEIIQRNLKGFREAGEALAEIRDTYSQKSQGRESRWSLIGYSNFEDYCKRKWGLSYTHADRLIASSKVMSNLETSPIGEVPKTESQARPLTKLPAEKQASAWERAQEIAAEEGKPVTAKHVEEAVEEVKAQVETPAKREPAFRQSNGMRYAAMAIDQLRKIDRRDTQREEAFKSVLEYINEQLNPQ